MVFNFAPRSHTIRSSHPPSTILINTMASNKDISTPMYDSSSNTADQALTPLTSPSLPLPPHLRPPPPPPSRTITTWLQNNI